MTSPLTCPPLVLAIDTSVGACSVALVQDGETPVCVTRAVPVCVTRTIPMDRGQAEALMPLIADVLAEARIPAPQIGAVAVTIGPGSFTGLRVGLAAARGLALAIGCPVLATSTPDVLADAALDLHPDGRVLVLIDTKRGDFYAQAFRGRTQNGYPAAEGDMGIVSREAAERAAQQGDVIVTETPLPDPVRLARLAWRNRNAAPSSARPLYLRPPDATPAPNGGRLWA